MLERWACLLVLHTVFFVLLAQDAYAHHVKFCNLRQEQPLQKNLVSEARQTVDWYACVRVLHTAQSHAYTVYLVAERRCCRHVKL